jgi:hypothetical protein
MQEKIDATNLFISNYLGITVWKLSLQGRFFFRIMNYQGFRKKPGNSPWDISSNQNLNYRQNFELYSFELTRFYYARFKSVSQEHIRHSCPPTRFESVVNEQHGK